MSNNIHNFCIFAHVDHGKSTLADRLLELTKTISSTKLQPQFLDTNPISRERGITIKLAPVRMEYLQGSKSEDQSPKYILNLIDTPGHVDFSYEVSRSLAACEGAILLVDAVKGIQAQTLSYFRKAKKQGLVIIPAINKIDLSSARVEETVLSMMEVFDFKEEEILFISAKTGKGVEKLLQIVIEKIPPPLGNPDFSLRALVFDSFYDLHKGVIACVRVVDGLIKPGSRLGLMATKTDFVPLEMGYFKPKLKQSDLLENGSVGYLATGLKDIKLVRAGDTVKSSQFTVPSSGSGNSTLPIRQCSKPDPSAGRHSSWLEIKRKKLKMNEKEVQPLEGYKQPKAMVFAGFYPIEQKDYKELVEGLERLGLNDSSLVFKPESSMALGKGFRVGFLGPLHLEVVLERLEREFDLQLITTAPNVVYEVETVEKKFKIENAGQLPEDYLKISEPIVLGIIFTPEKYLGNVMDLCREKRGKLLDMEHIGSLVKLSYKLPFAEVISNFFAQLKSLSSGFASFDYNFDGFVSFDGIKLDVIIADRKVDAFSSIVPREKAYQKGRYLVNKLVKVIPRQMFEAAIQASIGSRVIARATLRAYRKDVTAKLYGGDQTRKDKLLKKQKKGKKKMKAIGRIVVPQEAFLAVLGE